MVVSGAAVIISWDITIRDQVTDGKTSMVMIYDVSHEYHM